MDINIIADYINQNTDYTAKVVHQECAYYTCQDEIRDAKCPRDVINIYSEGRRWVMMLEFTKTKMLSYRGLNGWHVSGFDADEWKECIDYEFK